MKICLFQLGSICMIAFAIRGIAANYGEKIPDTTCSVGPAVPLTLCPSSELNCLHGSCVCPKRLDTFIDGKCRGVDDAECLGDAECIPGMTCSSGKCQCSKGTVPDFFSGLCIPTNGGPCLWDWDCHGGIGLRCIKRNPSDAKKKGVCGCAYSDEKWNPLSNFGMPPPGMMPLPGMDRRGACEVPFGTRCQPWSTLVPMATICSGGIHAECGQNKKCGCIAGYVYDKSTEECVEIRP